jgi:hypothetical protein
MNTIRFGPLHEMTLGGKWKLKVEHNELGITIADENDKTVCYLNCIGTAVLKEWLKDFDPKGRWLQHQSVKNILEKEEQ